MAILILYDTVEGHTEKIARFIADLVEQRGFEVSLSAAGQLGYCDPGTFDAAILCAPIHGGNYPDAFVEYVKSWNEALDTVPNALITVSLGIASKFPDEVAEARGFPNTLTGETGWEPANLHNTAGALKYVEYDYFRRWIMRRIAEHEGGPTDVSRDHELTDWKALETFITGFLYSLKV